MEKYKAELIIQELEQMFKRLHLTNIVQGFSENEFPEDWFFEIRNLSRDVKELRSFLETKKNADLIKRISKINTQEIGTLVFNGFYKKASQSILDIVLNCAAIKNLDTDMKNQDTNMKIPAELDNDIFRKIIKRTIEAGFMDDNNSFKEGVTQTTIAYWTVCANDKLGLTSTDLSSGKPRYTYKPFSIYFGLKDGVLANAKQRNNDSGKERNQDKINKIFDF